MGRDLNPSLHLAPGVGVRALCTHYTQYQVYGVLQYRVCYHYQDLYLCPQPDGSAPVFFGLVAMIAGPLCFIALALYQRSLFIARSYDCGDN